jgi:CsoR family transcriptional regulator, copper-sensing transcriptional repressor
LYDYYTPPGRGGVKDVRVQNQEELIKRLKTAEGHVRGIQRMVEDDVYCIDVIRQIQAVQSSLSKINAIILEQHLNSCLITAIKGEDPVERERVLYELAEVFSAASKS